MYNPPWGWANVADCGNFPCTGPHQSIFNFYDAVFEATDGTTALPSFWQAGTTKKTFQIVANNKEAAVSFPNSRFVPIWNAWFREEPAGQPFQIG